MYVCGRRYEAMLLHLCGGFYLKGQCAGFHQVVVVDAVSAFLVPHADVVDEAPSGISRLVYPFDNQLVPSVVLTLSLF